jgi:hypothetical protein
MAGVQGQRAADGPLGARRESRSAGGGRLGVVTGVAPAGQCLDCFPDPTRVARVAAFPRTEAPGQAVSGSPASMHTERPFTWELSR